MGRLRQDPYDLELLISFGTSKGGSAGHLALALREPGARAEWVYGANFYADRAEKHARGYYTADLITRVPKDEYLYGTRSSLGPDAQFGLDFGEAYKRSVVGIRVQGVAAAERAAIADYFARINDDYRARAAGTEYHFEEVRYDYMRFNCAKAIGVAFKYGAGYADLEVKEPRILPGLTTPVRALQSNVPTEMAMKLVREWHARGRTMDVVLYRKYPGSNWVDPLEEVKVAFKDLPNRFPSVISLDFTAEEGEYEDYDNLYAMYLLHNLARYSVVVDAATSSLEIERSKTPMAYEGAASFAKEAAEADRVGFIRRLPFVRKGRRIGSE
ncbi:MAG TPA: hypothetical protein VFV90_02255 [Usitatibacter sp.]|nr:hypothetical protein [Usitatibacter sp.]